MEKNDTEKNGRVGNSESNTTTTCPVDSRQHPGISNHRVHRKVTEENAVSEFMRTMRTLMEDTDSKLPNRRVYYEFLMMITKDFSQVLRKSSAALQTTANMLCSAPKHSSTSLRDGIALSRPVFKPHDCDIAGDILFCLYQSIRCWPLPLLETYLIDVLGVDQR